MIHMINYHGLLCDKCYDEWNKIYEASKLMILKTKTEEWSKLWNKTFAEFMKYGKEFVVFT